MAKREKSERIRFSCSEELKIKVINFYQTILSSCDSKDAYIKAIFALDCDAFASVLFFTQNIFFLCRDNVSEAIKLKGKIDFFIALEESPGEERDARFKERLIDLLAIILEKFEWEEDENKSDLRHFLDLVSPEPFFLLIKLFQYCLSAGIVPGKAEKYYSESAALPDKLEF